MISSGEGGFFSEGGNTSRNFAIFVQIPENKRLFLNDSLDTFEVKPN